MDPNVWPLSAKEKETHDQYTRLQDQFDMQFAQEFLFTSYRKMTRVGKSYPFLDPRGLQPGATGYTKLEDKVKGHKSGLVFFMKDRLEEQHSKHIRFKNRYKVTKKKFQNRGVVDKQFAQEFTHSHTLVGHPHFYRTLRELMRSDFGELIQPDPTYKRHAITHFRVEVDINLDESVEELARQKNIITQPLDRFEPSVAENLEARFFQYYGFSHVAGGRRRAAVKASHYLTKHELPFAIYVASSEERTLTRITPDNVIKYALVQLNKQRRIGVEKDNPGALKKVLHADNLALYRVVYNRPAVQGEEALHRNWLQRKYEHLMPRRKYPGMRPIEYPLIYKDKK
ncbi:MAG: hypothetical protein ACQESG_04410 [Nanobdellota archaeon]